MRISICTPPIVARQLLGRHVPVAKIRSKIEELLEASFLHIPCRISCEPLGLSVYRRLFLLRNSSVKHVPETNKKLS
jgi:hypothetical protein